MRSCAKIRIKKKKGSSKKISYERRAYESVDDVSLSWLLLYWTSIFIGMSSYCYHIHLTATYAYIVCSYLILENTRVILMHWRFYMILKDKVPNYDLTIQLKHLYATSYETREF